MKRISYLFLAFAAAFLASVVSAQTNGTQFTEKQLSVIETNLVVALETGLPSVQASAANVVEQVKIIAPDYGFSRAVIPLMRILKDENQLSVARITAALALNEIRSDMGDFAIKRTGEFTADQGVKHVCQLLVYERSQTD